MNHGERLPALPFTARGGPDPGHPTSNSTFSPDPIRPKTGCATAATEHGRKSHPSPRQARSAWTPSLLPWHARPIHPRPSVNRSKDPNRRRRRAISQGRRGLPERGHEEKPGSRAARANCSTVSQAWTKRRNDHPRREVKPRSIRRVGTTPTLLSASETIIRPAAPRTRPISFRESESSARPRGMLNVAVPDVDAQHARAISPGGSCRYTPPRV
jgi:hypothetical protein